jgi:hypothetical protein
MSPYFSGELQPTSKLCVIPLSFNWLYPEMKQTERSRNVLHMSFVFPVEQGYAIA